MVRQRLESSAMRERTAIDAFKDVIEGRIEGTDGLPWAITRISEEEKRLTNGVEYCFAEVSFPNGLQIGTEAYGDEARELHEIAIRARTSGPSNSSIIIAV